MSDRIFGVVCLLLAGFYIYSASTIELGFIETPVGPRAFPYIIGTLLALGGLYPILVPDERPDWPDMRGMIEIVFAVAVLIAYAFLLEDVGFVIATAFAAALLGWRLGTPPLRAAVSGVLISVGIYVIFHLILGLSLARGPWGF
ncbi:tripartite tricarboxylate transporter TctB family protein [Rhizobiales bacterium]|uniref:tripartite tricarboxylate transporter TctB family protein n=1 Tax=Hongsoonwoonella zoysiae TaxID=2821844 RepID=UPI0015614681|nr:tripartite tricarboxylate transporter TctB family protein [Hongsoonwoonella zoysiae]NRG19321.1 tripartite tricarboxylate transporter TctB family protein [Hongsoonwoonella zoysiae]